MRPARHSRRISSPRKSAWTSGFWSGGICLSVDAKNSRERRGPSFDPGRRDPASPEDFGRVAGNGSRGNERGFALSSPASCFWSERATFSRFARSVSDCLLIYPMELFLVLLSPSLRSARLWALLSSFEQGSFRTRCCYLASSPWRAETMLFRGGLAGNLEPAMSYEGF